MIWRRSKDDDDDDDELRNREQYEGFIYFFVVDL